MHLSLTKTLEDFVKSKVASGLYNNASEVVRHALRLLQERETAFEARLAGFRKEIDQGLQDLEQGRYYDDFDPDQLLAEIEAEEANAGSRAAS